ncbi:hypothetical protein ASU31_17620 [Pedobacter ginsenosidimutans]|uniref:Uncharacterized protein n=1 Tax=Pedobacter ginsenosidimutans TaxID=687842 RepID=A0A0T5VLH1_9SPHI|nr:hypothetical protein [Pedobacter ginsenosidimutans]KRT14723.1 hypothetical protein ASU31_17620 [Pedobacter ginsenosidimutans]
MAKKDKKATLTINALKCLNNFSQVEIEKFELLLKQPDERSKLLNELRIPIKKGLLVKKIIFNRVNFDINKILNCYEFNILSELEKQVSLEIKKDNLIKKINEKKIPIPKNLLREIILSETIDGLNNVIYKLPTNLKLELGKLKFRHSEPDSVSIIPIYTPMGNKR